jgi:hypothetical protein
MGGSLNMGRFAITHLREPSTGSDACTKGYIDRSVVPLVSTVAELSNNVVKKDGTIAMTVNLDLGRNSIQNVKDPAQGSDACTKGYVDRSITPLTNSINRLNFLAIKATGVEVNIDMQNHKFHNLRDPQDPQDAATKKYVDNNIFANRLIGSYEQIRTLARDLGAVYDDIRIPLVDLTDNPGNTIKIVFAITTTMIR